MTRLKNLLYRLPVKAALLCLIVAGAAGFGVLAAGFAYLYDVGAYYGVESYYETYRCSMITYRYMDNAIDAYVAGEDPTQEGGFLSREHTNFSYEILLEDRSEEVLLARSNGAAGDVLVAERVFQRPGLRNGQADYRIRGFVRDPIEVEDRYYWDYTLFGTLYPNRYRVIVAAVGCLLVGVLSLVGLLYGVGRRPGGQGVVLRAQDRIPLDLFLFGAAALALGCFLLPLAVFGFNSLVWSEIALTGAAWIAAVLVALSALASLAARVKGGRWWENSLLYRIGSRLFGLLRRLGAMVWVLLKELPILWKMGTAFCVAQGINLMLAYLAFSEYYLGALILCFVFNLLLLGAVCLLTLGLQRLKETGERLAAGEIDYKTDTRWLRGELLRHAATLNRIGEGIGVAVSQRLRSERLKSELITNVSHDLKTPLTSIINYVDLLQQEMPDGKAGEYVQVLDRQAQRLKKLTEDLVEASKAATGNLAVEKSPVDLWELAEQVAGEYAERLELQSLELVTSLPSEPVSILADGRHLWRVLDNLLGNIEKYAQPHTRVYLDVQVCGGEAAIVLKNISHRRLNVDAQELMERFVRGDAARSTEGSGLGLNIARSLVELQGGRFELLIDGDLFKAAIYLPRCSQREESPLQLLKA